ncbi:MAG: PTS system mannose/fructose/sorbose family transporter subunit IID [Syntrophales bacterium LBB04]|nr:PTS system mannose/fructose/sorbose family transporter subunit IID [Syntrophales bacterium LBB04]
MNSAQVSTGPSNEELTAPDQQLPLIHDLGDTAAAWKIFISSFFIQGSFNYRGMQNLGFAFAMLPLAKGLEADKKSLIAFLTRHLQLFNTHPYLSSPIVGSVVQLEIDHRGSDEVGPLAVNLKNALTGPYAALGDSFFWGAMKPMAAIFAVLVALQQSLLAPFALLVLYNPAHLLVRSTGFVAGYRHGKEGIFFIRRLELPYLTGRIRWISLFGLGGIAVTASPAVHISLSGFPFTILAETIYLSLIILCYWGIKNGISQVKILYCMFIVSCGLSF